MGYVVRKRGLKNLTLTADIGKNEGRGERTSEKLI